MANNNRSNFENALAVVDMANLKVTYEIGKNVRQVTRLYVWDGNKKIVDQSVSALTKQVFFEDLLKDIRNEHANPELVEEIEDDMDEEYRWEEQDHQENIAFMKKFLLEEIANSEYYSAEEHIQWYLDTHGLNDMALCEGWLDLQKLHKVVKLANGKYYTDSQLEMVNDVIRRCKKFGLI